MRKKGFSSRRNYYIKRGMSSFKSKVLQEWWSLEWVVLPIEGRLLLLWLGLIFLLKVRHLLNYQVWWLEIDWEGMRWIMLFVLLRIFLFLPCVLCFDTTHDPTSDRWSREKKDKETWELFEQLTCKSLSGGKWFLKCGGSIREDTKYDAQFVMLVVKFKHHSTFGSFQQHLW